MKKLVITKSGKWKILVVFCILLCIVFTSISVSRKERFHVDEIWSYSLSNSTSAPFYYWTCKGLGPPGSISRQEDFDIFKGNEFMDFFDSWRDGGFYHEYITVQSDERFNYGNVFYNQMCDVHPPLYYCIIHTVCSLTPDVFSKWQGLVPNLIFYTATLIFLYLLARELTGSEKIALLSALFWGLSGGAVSCTSFIRMYSLLTMLSVMSAYFYIMFYRTLKTRYVIFISITVLAGLLTQYTFYFFAFFMTLLFCGYFLFKKKIMEFFGLGLSVVSAVLAAIAIFPPVIIHVFNGAFTEHNKSLNKDFFKDDMFDKLLKSLFSSYFFGISDTAVIILRLGLIIALTAAGIMLLLKIKNKKKIIFPEKYIPITMLTVSVILTSIFVGKATVDMRFCSERYFFFILPYFSIIICCAVILILRKAFSKLEKQNKKRLCYSIWIELCVLAVCISNTGITNAYIKQSDQLDIKNEISGKSCFFITNDHIIHAFAPYMQEASKVYSIYDKNEPDEEFIQFYEQLNEMKEDYILISYVPYESILPDEFYHNKVSFPMGHRVKWLGKVKPTIEFYEYDVFRVTVS